MGYWVSFSVAFEVEQPSSELNNASISYSVSTKTHKQRQKFSTFLLLFFWDSGEKRVYILATYPYGFCYFAVFCLFFICFQALRKLWKKNVQVNISLQVTHVGFFHHSAPVACMTQGCCFIADLTLKVSSLTSIVCNYSPRGKEGSSRLLRALKAGFCSVWNKYKDYYSPLDRSLFWPLLLTCKHFAWVGTPI